jgi:hypothetical protein
MDESDEFLEGQPSIKPGVYCGMIRINVGIIFYLAFGWCWLNAKASPQEQHPSSMPLFEYLRMVGPRVGCHFTWESKEPPPGATWKYVEIVTNDLNITSIPQLISTLRHDLDGFIVEPDPQNPKIIQITERTLAEDSNYALNKRINLKYSGGLMGYDVWDAKHGYFVGSTALIETVAGIIPGIADQTEDSGNWDGFGDRITKVSVDTTNETVREVFTGSLPLTNYSSVLWMATATTGARGPWVWVLFGGPNKP